MWGKGLPKSGRSAYFENRCYDLKKERRPGEGGGDELPRRLRQLLLQRERAEGDHSVERGPAGGMRSGGGGVERDRTGFAICPVRMTLQQPATAPAARSARMPATQQPRSYDRQA